MTLTLALSLGRERGIRRLWPGELWEAKEVLGREEGGWRLEGPPWPLQIPRCARNDRCCAQGDSAARRSGGGWRCDEGMGGVGVADVRGS